MLALVGACLVCGCAGAVHQLPQIDQTDLSMAQSEVQSGPRALTRHPVTDEEARQAMRAALARIQPVALQLCHEMKTGACVWTFRESSDRSMNASAAPNGVIVVNRGIVEFADSDDEVAMVIAHEIGHQSANHVATSQRNQQVGTIVGGILVGALVGVATRGAATQAGTELGSTIGGSVGRIAFSKEQEREADYLAAVTLYRSGMDLDKARVFLVKMAKASNRKETGTLDTTSRRPRTRRRLGSRRPGDPCLQRRFAEA